MFPHAGSVHLAEDLQQVDIVRRRPIWSLRYTADDLKSLRYGASTVGEGKVREDDLQQSASDLEARESRAVLVSSLHLIFIRGR